jgi:hypothetical protein
MNYYKLKSIIRIGVVLAVVMASCTKGICYDCAVIEDTAIPSPDSLNWEIKTDIRHFEYCGDNVDKIEKDSSYWEPVKYQRQVCRCVKYK